MFLGATWWHFHWPDRAFFGARLLRAVGNYAPRKLAVKLALTQPKARRPPLRINPRDNAVHESRSPSARRFVVDQPINWPSVLLPALRGGGLRLRGRRRAERNIVRMAFYLVLSLAATAGLFFLAGADFVGSMQMMIYVGGTLVLLIFGVMLTAQGPLHLDENRPRRNDRRGARRRVPACSVLVWAAVSVPAWKGLDRATAEAIQLQPTAIADRHGAA